MSKFDKIIKHAISKNSKDEVIKITKPLSLEDAKDIIYRIILEKKLEKSEDDPDSYREKTVEYYVQNKLKKN